MQALLLRLADTASPTAGWILAFAAAVAAALVALVGVALVAALRAKTPQEQRYRLTLFREFLQFLLGLFAPRKER